MGPGLEFSARVLLVGVNPYVEVSAERAAALRPGWRRPLPVVVRLNGGPERAWTTNLMPVGEGQYVLYLHGAMRKAANVGVGDVVAIHLSVDHDYRNGPRDEMPEWFRAALDRDSRASINWTRLTPSRQKEVLRYFAALKTADARERNLRRAMIVLAGSSGRFLGRDWVDGR
jgi:Domain of unknown function (DUF1905)/Bacteriocin-protection, YdeI or OmpD-Associated